MVFGVLVFVSFIDNIFRVSDRYINKLTLFEIFGIRMAFQIDHEVAFAASSGRPRLFDEHAFIQSAA